jgi:hypothetical protein
MRCLLKNPDPDLEDLKQYEQLMAKGTIKKCKARQVGFHAQASHLEENADASSGEYATLDCQYNPTNIL